MTEKIPDKHDCDLCGQRKAKHKVVIPTGSGPYPAIVCEYCWILEFEAAIKYEAYWRCWK